MATPEPIDDRPPSKRAQRKAHNDMVKKEALRRLGEMIRINDHELNLLGLSSALLNLRIDVWEFPAATTVVRAMMGLDAKSNPLTAHIELAARIDELRKRAAEFRTESQRPIVHDEDGDICMTWRWAAERLEQRITELEVYGNDHA